MFKSNGNSQNDKLEIKARDNIKTQHTRTKYESSVCLHGEFFVNISETILKDNYFDSAKAPT